MDLLFTFNNGNFRYFDVYVLGSKTYNRSMDVNGGLDHRLLACGIREICSSIAMDKR